MRDFKINLGSVQDVQEFVGLATTMAFHVAVADRHHGVNGKSFMEMFCLDLKHPLTVSADCAEEEWEAFRAAAQHFLAED